MIPAGAKQLWVLTLTIFDTASRCLTVLAVTQQEGVRDEK